MSEAKVRLKRAKDLIDEQQWQKALEILEHLCREDGDNPRPQALVLVGKCALELQNAHKALEAFRTAVKIQPDLIPAWQGLLMCHSRFPSPDLPAPPSVIGDGDEKARRNEELLEAYRRCLEHIGDNEQMKPRILEYLKGYAAQLIIKERIEDALQTLQRLSLMATGYGNKDFRIGARKDIIRLLHPVKYQTDLFSLVEAHLELLLGTYRELLTEYDLGVIEDNFPQEHLSVLLQLSRVDEAVAFARKYAEDFGSPFAYAAILMFLLKAALQAGTLDDHLRSEIIVMQEKMASFDAQHPLVRISKAYQAYLKRDFIRSTELWEKALFSVKGLDTLPEAYKVPLLADLQLYSRKYLAISWVSTENTSSLSAGVDVLRECCQCIPDWQTFFYHGYAEISMGHVREAEQVLRGAYEFFAGPDHLDTRIIIGALEGALALKEGDYLKAEQSCEEALMMMEENHLFHYTLFRSFWDSRRRDPRRCLKHLQRCIELCPGFGVAQVYMALWKWRVEQDHEAAVDCYVRAYTLRPSDASVVRAYTDFCTVERQDAKAMEILQTALESKKFTAEDSRWMRLRLALLAYRNMLWQDCINNLRSVLRDFPVDRLIQEFLGDALCFRGNYWSAMGIFEGVIEAAARDGQFADYSWSRRAFIKQLLKLDDEAEKEFEELHRRAAWHRQTCLQSLAQLQIKKAKAAFAAYFPICGIQCCQKAIDLLTEAIFSSGNCSAFIWSLLGDACILMRFIGPGSGDLLVDHFLWDGTQRGDKIKLNIRQILYLATIFYSTAIDMKRTSARLWERLAVSYWFLAQRVSSHDDDKEGARKWMNRALLAVKEMLLRNPNNPWLWTTAGFVVGSPSAVGLNSPADAARMLTKAVEIFSRLELNPTSVAQTWVSLGYLYLNEKRYMAAHEILKQAQSADPGLAEAWQGQAWCAEKTGYSVEAIDLCRHACTLGLLPESMRRYAEWIIWVLHDKTLDSHLKHEILVRLEAVPTALNYLGQYVQMYPQDVRISMLMSSLQEWAGLRKSALLSAQRALDLIGNSGERFEPTNNRTWNMAKINVARLLCATGEYRSALDMMGSVDMEPTLNILIFMAVLNFRLGNFDECVAMLDMTLEDEYETTGKEANNNNDGEESYRCTKLPLSHAVILAKAAVVVYSVVDDNDGEYVKNLVQLYEEKTDINIRLKCLCLMAILDREIFREMASIFLQEIYEFRWNNMDHHLSSIVLVTKLMEADQETAERNACRFVHIRPERHDLRLIMARVISADPTEENLLYADAIHTAVEMNEHVGRMKRFEPSLNIWQEVVDHWLLAKIRSDENTHDENGVGGISSRCLQKAVRLFPMQSWQDYL